MLANSLVAFVHFVCAFGIAATLFFEWLTFSRAPTIQDARRLAMADRWYGLFAMTLVVVGLLRAFYFEKGIHFYLATPFFHLKLTLFVLIGLLSIYPTMTFLRWRPALRAGQAPQLSEVEHKRVARLLGAQLWLLAGVMLSASLMAKGLRF